ncbi:MAG: hypothetical protein NT007_09685 [Candidatus Kapabacteria bacterium]|nr:hypothetical protein [Candidatus Kapabacteria bacterium]
MMENPSNSDGNLAGLSISKLKNKIFGKAKITDKYKKLKPGQAIRSIDSDVKKLKKARQTFMKAWNKAKTAAKKVTKKKK